LARHEPPAVFAVKKAPARQIRRAAKSPIEQIG
jgi:hypothetical protein